MDNQLNSVSFTENHIFPQLVYSASSHHRSIGQETQAPGQLDLLPEGECSDGSLEGDRDGPVAQVELAERHLAGLGRGQVSVGEPSGPRAAPKP